MTVPVLESKDLRALKPRRRRDDSRTAWIFVAPAMIGFLLFFLYPTIRGIYLSFTKYNLLRPPQWIGFGNYTKIWSDPLFWNAMKVTIEYVILNIVFQTIIAIGLAVLMQRLTKSTVIRGTLLLPFLVANVVVALLWFWLLDYQIGIVNAFLGHFGIGPIAFFGDENLAIPTIAFVNTWRHMGYTALLIFAGLQTIPRFLYEAASVDGASESRQFWRITMPLLRPVLVLVLVITVTGSFQVFDTVAVTTHGGPINATRVIQYYIVQRAFAQSDFGYGAALSVILFIILGIVAAVQMRLLRADESDIG